MSKTTDVVTTTVIDNTAVLTLNRASDLNTLNREMAIALKAATEGLLHTSEIRCVIIQGAGDHFMAGGDLKMFMKIIEDYERTGDANFSEIFSDIHDVINNLRKMDMPVIAKVRGAVAGFGLSLMLACDMVIASDDAVFTMAYCKIGTTPDGGGTFFLPRHVGMKKAMEISLLGDRFTAEDALNWGLINRVVTPNDLDDCTFEFAQKICAGSATALAKTKKLINQSFTSTLEQQLEAESIAFQQSMKTADFAEGLRAFHEKRAAKFN